jgi:hypothetical protein
MYGHYLKSSKLARQNTRTANRRNFMDLHKLETTACAMVAEGKSILAMDESTSTCDKRLQNVGEYRQQTEKQSA